jgi:group I intron endonuclease
MKTNPCIYKIKCSLNKLFYIGSAIDINRRIYLHTYYLNKNTHDNRYLQEAWNKYGEINFKFEILERVSQFKLIEREQFWLDDLKPFAPHDGFNIATKAGSQLGYKHTDETKAKLSAKLKGKKLSREHILKISRALSARVIK